MADHRAEQVMAGVMSALADIEGVDVIRAPMDPLSEDLQELPALVVAMGDDSPAGENGFLVNNAFDSLLTVNVTIYAREKEHESIETTLNAWRKLVHIELMGSSRLGLSFVIDLYPSGAGEPERSDTGQQIYALMNTTWAVQYRSSINDPSA